MLSLVIPAYNEEAHIRKTLGGFHKYLSKKAKAGGFEIIVVTDGSTDHTNEIVQGFGKGHKEVRLLSFPNRLGKGGGVIEGFKAAKGGLIGFADGDASVAPAEFGKLIDAMENEPGIAAAISSRYVQSAKWLEREPLKIIIASRVFNVLVNLLFFLGVADTQCGGKLFMASGLKKVVPKMRTKGFAFDVELLWRMKRFGIIREVGIVWTHSVLGSKTRLRDFYKILFDVLRVRIYG